MSAAGTVEHAAASNLQGATATPKGLTPELLRYANALGFRRVMRKGTLLFCKDDVRTGGRITREQCFDIEHLTVMLKEEYLTQKAWNRYVSPLTCSSTGKCTL